MRAARVATPSAPLQWLAAQIDLWCAVSLFVAYNLAIILIYTLQSGYINLLNWEGPPPPEWSASRR